jgi:mitochondrial import receptor subunit TOM40
MHPDAEQHRPLLAVSSYIRVCFSTVTEDSRLPLHPQPSSSSEEEGRRGGMWFGGLGTGLRQWAGSLLSPTILRCDDSGEQQGGDLIEQANKAQAQQRRTQCPGQFADSFNEVKRLVQVDTFDGFKFDMQKPLTPTFAVSHGLWLGSSLLPGGSMYHYSATVADVGDKLIMGRVSQDGDVDGRVHFPIGPVMNKLSLSLGRQQDMIMWNCEYANESGACQMGIGKGPQVQLSFNQAVWRGLSVGMDTIYNGEQKLAPVSWGAKYNAPSWAATAHLNQGIVQLQYLRRVSQRVQLGTELATNPFNPEQSMVTVGAEFRMKQSTYQCSVDGSGKIDASLESRFLPMASLILTGQLNHAENAQRFGFALQMQGQ